MDVARSRRPVGDGRLRFPIAVLSGLAWLLPTAAAVGDIAPDPLGGGVNMLGKSDAVRMAGEVVTLTVTPDRCTTHAVFQMKNLTADDVTMEVGFPFAYPTDLEQFTVDVDGKAMKDVSLKSRGRRRKWYVWDMTFPAEKTTTVTVDYQSQLDWPHHSWNFDGGNVQNLLLSFTAARVKRQQATEEEKLRYEVLKKRLRYEQVQYIMTTGAGWAGTIGSARIEAKFQGFTSDNLVTRYPKPGTGQFSTPTVKRDGLIWEKKDFEPTNDIVFYLSPNITRRELKAWAADLLRERPHHPELTRMVVALADGPQETARADALFDAMLVHWSTRMTFDGPGSDDPRRSRLSVDAWNAARSVTYAWNPRPPRPARARRLAPVLTKFADEMLAQLPPVGETSNRLTDGQIEFSRRGAEELRTWAAAQTEDVAVQTEDAAAAPGGERVGSD